MRLSAGAGLLTIGLFLSGCCLFMEPPPPPPPDACKVSLTPSSEVAFDDVWVHQEGDQLVLEGELHPRSFIQKAAGHVDVRIVDANGSLLKELKVSPKESVFTKQNGRVSPFSATIDMVVSPDSTVMLKAHGGPAAQCE